MSGPSCSAEGDNSKGCTKKHRKRFMKCAVRVVYEIPFTCGKCYIGQTEKCINERLMQHQWKFNRWCQQGGDGHQRGTIIRHRMYCGCEPDFHGCKLIAEGYDREAREITEANEINQARERCVSFPSVVPSEFSDERKTHRLDVLDSEPESEVVSGSDSDDELVPASVCEPVLESSRETVLESVSESIAEPAMEPNVSSLQEAVLDSVRERVSGFVHNPAAEFHSGMSERQDIVVDDSLLKDLVLPSTIHSGRVQRLMGVMEILRIMKCDNAAAE